MTEQLKAEAYVKEQRPALMETSRVGITAMYNYEINLQDWLAVLDGQLDTCGKFYVIKRGERIGEDETEDEVVAIFNFNLTTGQPATQADFKAFNDIVSV